MYFAMDEIGFENTERIKLIPLEADRWRFIYDVAKAYGYEGIHLTPSLYNKNFELDLKNIPAYFQDFKLTLHFGGLHNITAYEAFDEALSKHFDIALRNNMHDFSLHPPGSGTSEEKDVYRSLLSRAINKWLPIAIKNGISLSLETHVTGEYFLFNGLGEFVAFTDQYPDLGILIDVSHNYYNPQYSEEDMINILSGRNVKCLHISDALRSADFESGTHLAIGDGEIDFLKLLDGFKNVPDLYSVLEIKSKNYGIEKSLRKLKEITKHTKGK